MRLLDISVILFRPKEIGFKLLCLNFLCFINFDHHLNFVFKIQKKYFFYLNIMRLTHLNEIILLYILNIKRF